jgi:23S rRNA pseudouridine955/2504/2580 synthase
MYHPRMLKKDAQSQVRIVEVDASNEGQRIDNFLLGQLKGVPRSLVYRLLRTGQVRVNMGRSKPHYKLRAGDLVRIPPVRQSEPSAPISPRAGDLERLNSQILYEDKSLIIINKPSGMAVHGGSGLSYGVIEAFRVLRPKEKFLELVHRLDRETSGCLVLARKRSALVRLHEMLRRERGERMDKTYQTLVKGIWTGPKQRVNQPLLRNVRKSGERVVQISEEGKAACSVFVPLKNYPSAKSALLEVRLLTGRTHQARVHAACIDHPIAGDEKYGDRDFNKKMRQAGLNRLFLHASRLRFRHPLEDKLIDIEAPLPEDLITVLDNIS